jgi:hypothetical protein
LSPVRRYHSTDVEALVTTCLSLLSPGAGMILLAHIGRSTGLSVSFSGLCQGRGLRVWEVDFASLLPSTELEGVAGWYNVRVLACAHGGSAEEKLLLECLAPAVRPFDDQEDVRPADEEGEATDNWAAEMPFAGP